MTSRRILVCSAGIALSMLLTAAWGADPAAPAAAKGSPIPPSPEFTSPDIKPTLKDWLTAKPIARFKKLKATDPLLRPPFAAAPVDTLKGMAAGIRTVELDIPNRVLAVRYLATVDCVTYPKARDMLVATMLEDPAEEVRYEAVMALRLMFTHACGGANAGSSCDGECECDSCNQRKKAAKETKKFAKKPPKVAVPGPCGKPTKVPFQQIKPKKHGLRDIERRYDCCRGCCDAAALEALSKVAYDHDDQCFFEPSERVRAAAAEALLLCNCVPGYPAYPEPVLPPDEEKPSKGEVAPIPNKEVEPPVEPLETPPAAPPVVPEPVAPLAPVAPVAPLAPVSPVTPPTAAIQPQPPARLPSQIQTASRVPSRPLEALRGYCPVALKSRQFVAADPRFTSVHEDRSYNFSSAEAKADFDRNPARFAPAFAGIDPVAWLEQQVLTEGRFLREYEGRFYLFASKENWETFKSAPHRYTLDTQDQDDLELNEED